MASDVLHFQGGQKPLVRLRVRVGKSYGRVAKFLKNTKLTLENLATERARLIEAGGDASKVDERTRAAETELAILTLYGPKQMTEAQLREVISDFRAKNPDANVGTIMAHLKTSFGGQYDGKAASALAKA
jgi:hypothetical protein